MDTLKETASVGTLLFVDDEINILKSLQRLFVMEGFQVMTAENAEIGLSILEQHPVDIVVSDMRMPGMNGAEFLKIAAKKWPETRRFLLTGHADIQAAIAAINEGKVDFYISKPWKNEALIKDIHSAMEVRTLRRRNQELQALLEKQNEELKIFNAQLEEKVEERTLELKEAYKNLKASYQSTIEILLSLVELHEGKAKGHCREIAEHAKLLAQKLNLSEVDVLNIYLAAMLHNLGKVGISPHLKFKPFFQLNAKEYKEFTQYPLLGATLLLAFEPLKEVSTIVLSHKELFNGKGFPHKLRGEYIPLGARILSVVIEYHELQQGLLRQEKCHAQMALEYLIENAEKRYDPTIVKAFVDMIHALPTEKTALKETQLTPHELDPGMRISRNLVSPHGFLLLVKNTVLTKEVIEKLKELGDLKIYIKTP